MVGWLIIGWGPDPLPCEASTALAATVPSPSLVEVFPGTVPLNASELASRQGAPRHGSFTPFPQQRTVTWFLPVLILLLGIVVWNLVGITIKVLRRHHSGRPRVKGQE